MSHEIRRATATDAATVAQLLHDFNTEFESQTPGPEVLTERYSRVLGSGEAVVLLSGDGPDGFAQLRFRAAIVNDGLDAHLEELYVVPELRARGLGRALLEAAMQTAREQGATRIDLGTSEADTAARALYESAGFTNEEDVTGRPLMLYYEREL